MFCHCGHSCIRLYVVFLFASEKPFLVDTHPLELSYRYTERYLYFRQMIIVGQPRFQPQPRRNLRPRLQIATSRHDFRRNRCRNFSLQHQFATSAATLATSRTAFRNFGYNFRRKPPSAPSVHNPQPQLSSTTIAAISVCNFRRAPRLQHSPRALPATSPAPVVCNFLPYPSPVPFICNLRSDLRRNLAVQRRVFRDTLSASA